MSVTFSSKLWRIYSLGVADILHETGDGVAEMEGDGIGFGLLDVFEDGAVAG